MKSNQRIRTAVQSASATAQPEGTQEINDRVSRRTFLATTSKAGGALVVGCFLDGTIGVIDAANPTEAQLNAWVRIAGDDSVTIVVSQAEMGQGIMTTLPAVLAEELGPDWDRVRLEMSPTAEAYRNPRLKWQFTGNSESTMSFFDLMRQVGAGAREMLVSVAADRWKVAPSSCTVDRGVVHHRSSSRKLSFGQLAETASRKSPPQNPALKPQTEWKILGKSQPKVDIPSKVDGSAIFGIDFELPGMVYAAVKNSPCFGGKLKSFDKSSIEGFPGVLDVVAVPGGVSVAAKTSWQAKVALDALRISWEDGPEADLNSPNISERYEQAMAGQEWVLVREVGDPDAIRHSYANVRLAGKAEPVSTPANHSGQAFAKLYSAEFESQFLAHAPMEPMNASARISEDGCEIWAPTQGQELAQLMVSEALGLPKEKVKVNRTLLGGGFDFSTLVAGHVTRVGNRADVELSIELYDELRRTAVSALDSISLAAFAKEHGSQAKDKWDLHNEYEKAVVDRCYAELLPKWKDRLADTSTYLRDNCWAMMESVIVTLAPEKKD